ncbi:hypothetical protein NESM_000412200 [Novymonas esmeraldas]|uniref:Uncharacterized protein n=1 Tax=Novymonas esmeraldas TaxID=1808958 RepID=A0AAW0EMM3_9TRYP
MFAGVGAFLEAMDKKTEALADAAEEQDLAHAAQQHQQQQQQHLQSSSRVSSSASLYHLHHQTPVLGVTTAAAASPATATAAGGVSATPLISSSSAQLEPYTTGYAAISLPTKLPSLRTTQPGASTERSASGHAALVGAKSLADPADVMRHASTALAPSSAAHTHHQYNNNNSSSGGGAAAAAAAAVAERLEAQCRTLEAEKLRWQQETATQRAQCTAAREALWKAEQDTRASRAAQRAAEQALVAYKDTSQRLLEESQREVQRARDAVAGRAPTETAEQQQEQQQKETNPRLSAEELHQRLTLLQADHAVVCNEAERHRQEVAKVSAELQRVHAGQRQAQARVEALLLEVDTARESLEGEVAAHTETRVALRRLQAQDGDTAAGATSSGGASAAARAVEQVTDDAGGAAAAVAQLAGQLKDMQQRYHKATLQCGAQQVALDAAAREAAEMKARYNELALRVNDAEVEVAAGFRAFPPPPASSLAAPREHHGTRAGGSGADVEASAALMRGGTEPLRRHPDLVRLARQYGAAGRAAVTAICALDSAAVRVGRVLTQSRWVWRVALMGYLSLLQVWVILVLLGTFAFADSADSVVVMSRVAAPLPA